jgi:hypothetical protein
MIDENQVKQLINAWRIQPEKFVREVLGVEFIEPWQLDALRRLNTSKRVSIRSGHSTGKSTLLCWIILWWLRVYIGVKIPCTAGSDNQLKDVLWSDLKRWCGAVRPEWREICPYIWTSERLTLAGMEDINFAVPRVAKKENPDTFQGFHAKHLLMVVDEASAIAEGIFEVAEGALASPNAKMIVTGNPTRTGGYFYRTFTDDNRWERIHISTLDIKRPDTDPKSYADGIAEAYGIDSNVYRVRVLGEFPLLADDGIISLHDIRTAVNRPVEPYGDEIFWGIDVAFEGRDKTAIAKRKGNRLLEPIIAWAQLDAEETADRIEDIYYKDLEKGMAPDKIFVDSIGAGAAVVSNLRRRKQLPVVGVNITEASSSKKEYHRLREDLWFRCKYWFKAADVCIPEDDELMKQLAAVGFKPDQKTGAARIFDKSANLGYSPDYADSFILTFMGKDRNIKSNIALRMKKMFKPTSDRAVTWGSL